MCTALNNAKSNVEGVKEFFKVNAEISAVRNENIFEVIPEMAELEQWMKENS